MDGVSYNKTAFFIVVKTSCDSLDLWFQTAAKSIIDNHLLTMDKTRVYSRYVHQQTKVWIRSSSYQLDELYLYGVNSLHLHLA